MSWTWFKTGQPAPVPPAAHLYQWFRTRLFGRFQDGYNAFGPYRRPIQDATGGGTLNLRQLSTYAPNMVVNHTTVKVAITGDGSELTGQYIQTGLVNVSNQAAPISDPAQQSRSFG